MIFVPYGLPLTRIGGASGAEVDIPIPPHTNNETESNKIGGIDE